MVGCYEKGRAITAIGGAPQWKNWGGGSDDGSGSSEEGWLGDVEK